MNECEGCEYYAEDGTCGAFECNGTECPDLPCEQWWIFTFGYGHKHAGKYVKIRGTYTTSRNKMFEKYGDQWAFQYPEKDFEELSNSPWKETELEVIE